MYLDDIIVFSNLADEHICHVDEVLTALRNAGVTTRLDKCTFFTATVNYLGHTVRRGLLVAANKNAAAIQRLSIPTTQTELRSFLGMCNVYRRFIPNFAEVASPLNSLLRKRTPVLPEFSGSKKESFDKLKRALANPPVLALPQPELPFSVDTDALNFQIGCALFHKHEDGVRYPIGFWSRSLSDS